MIVHGHLTIILAWVSSILYKVLKGSEIQVRGKVIVILMMMEYISHRGFSVFDTA